MWLTGGASGGFCVGEEGPRDVAAAQISDKSWAVLTEVLITGTMF